MIINNIIRLLGDSIANFIYNKHLHYITESADWVIKHHGIMITKHLTMIQSRITTTHYAIRNSIVHYGSINTFFSRRNLRLPHKSNKIVVTWFHILSDDERTALIPMAISHVNLWHTACEITKQKMLDIGIPKDKIIVIPCGIDINNFTPPSLDGKMEIKSKLGIPKDVIVVGSFQKDGVGWGEGKIPKLIKGPDIFCNVVEKLAKKFNIFVLLAGPSRGYVKTRLTIAGIPYRHDFLVSNTAVADYYKACDLYIIASRVEGGPKSLLEAMGCGVPLVSTRVGMAPDIIIDGENGFLVDVEDIDSLYDRCCRIFEKREIGMRMAKNGLESVKKYDWKIITNLYYEKIYKIIA